MHKQEVVLGCKIRLNDKGLTWTRNTSKDKNYAIVSYTPNDEALQEEAFYFINDAGAKQVVLIDQFYFAEDYDFSEEFLRDGIVILERLFDSYGVKYSTGITEYLSCGGKGIRVSINNWSLYYHPWLVTHMGLISDFDVKRGCDNALKIARNVTIGLLNSKIRREKGKW